MPDSDLIKKILTDAESEAQATLSQAQAEADKITTEAKKEADKKKKEILKKSEIEAEKTSSQLIAVARQKAKLETEAAKDSYIQDIKKEAEEIIIAWSTDKYTAWLETELKKIKIETENDIVCKTAPKRVTETEQALKNVGLTIPVKADKNISAGVVLESPKSVYDLSLIKTITEVLTENKADLASVLFNDSR
jgi:vacuolar-type H+-ATPase subunit E/Vma4